MTSEGNVFAPGIPHIIKDLDPPRNGLAKSAATAQGLWPDQLLLVTAAAPETAFPPWISSLTWKDRLPNFTDFTAIAIELPYGEEQRARMESLFEEIQFAVQSGALILWLISEDSADDLITRATGVPFMRLREPSSGSNVRLLEPRLGSIIETLTSFRVAFRTTEDWHSFAALPSGASVSVGRRNAKSGAVTSLVLPISSANKDSTLRALALWVKSELEQRSHRASGKRGVLGLAAMVVFLCLFVIGARISQQRQNRAIRESGSWYSPIEEIAFGDLAAADWPAKFRAPVASLSEEEISTQLAITLSIGDHFREDQLIQHLLSDRRPSGADLVGEHIGSLYEASVTEAVTEHRYERARFLAQRFINISDQLPYWTGFHQFNRSEINDMRRVLDLVGKNYVYHDVDSSWLSEALTSSWYNEGRVGDPSKLDPTLVDNVAYTQANMADEGAREEAWVTFASTYPDSEKRDDALFNILNEVIVVPTLGLEKAWAFQQEFPTSYLADDALFYVVRLSVEGGDWAQAARAFCLLARDYAESDSLKRLQYLMLRERGWEAAGTEKTAVEKITRAAARLPTTTRPGRVAPEADEVEVFLRNSLSGLLGGEWNE
jgi:hypothetical protein